MFVYAFFVTSGSYSSELSEGVSKKTLHFIQRPKTEQKMCNLIFILEYDEILITWNVNQ